MTGPAGCLVHGIVGAEDLRATGHQRIASRGVVDSRLPGIGVRAGSDQVAFLYQRGDLGSRTVVPLDEGRVRLAGFSIGEDDASP